MGYAYNDGQTATKVCPSPIEGSDRSQTKQEQTCQSEGSGKQYAELADTHQAAGGILVDEFIATLVECPWKKHHGVDARKFSIERFAHPIRNRLEVQARFPGSGITHRSHAWVGHESLAGFASTSPISGKFGTM
jgi:hypothetical protein